MSRTRFLSPLPFSPLSDAFSCILSLLCLGYALLFLLTPLPVYATDAALWPASAHAQLADSAQTANNWITQAFEGNNNNNNNNNNNSPFDGVDAFPHYTPSSAVSSDGLSDRDLFDLQSTLSGWNGVGCELELFPLQIFLPQLLRRPTEFPSLSLVSYEHHLYSCERSRIGDVELDLTCQNGELSFMVTDGQ